MMFRVLAELVPRAVRIQLVIGFGGAILWGAFGTGRLAVAALFGGFIGVVLGIHASARFAALQRQQGSPGQSLWSLVQMEIVRIVIAIALLYLALWLLPDAYLATLSTFAATLLVYPFVSGAESGVASER
jgi:F0F1-type ATP synthase assembly protein I